MQPDSINNSNDRLDERIERFIKDQMTPEERDGFIRELKEDKQLRERAATMVLLLKGIQKVGAEKDKKMLEGARYQVKKPVRKVYPFVRNVAFKVLSVAACLCLLFSVYDYQSTKNATYSLAADALVAYHAGITDGQGERGAADESQVISSLEDVFAKVQQGEQVKENIKCLSEYFELSVADTFNDYTNHFKDIGYFLAVAYLQDNDREEAVRVLKRILELDPDFVEGANLLKQISEVKYFYE